MPDSERETIINPDDQAWRVSNLMQLANADLLERTGSTRMGARIWKLPPMRANTLHKHVRSEEFYFVLSGLGRIRVDGRTHTIEKNGGIHVWPEQMRQVFNDTEATTTWLIFGAPDDEFPHGTKPDPEKFYPLDPKQLPSELEGTVWPRDAKTESD
ncbi:MAG: cupin domain-containing protein [Verrucomicrobiota bacterium]